MTVTLLLEALVAGFAGFRLARALTVDTITDPLRATIYPRAYRQLRTPRRRTPADETAPLPSDRVEIVSRPWAWLYGLVSCPHCAGWWITLAVCVIWFGAWSVAFAVTAVGAAGLQSALASLTAEEV